MIKFASFLFRNPFVQRIQYLQSTTKEKRNVFSKQHEQFINSLKDSYQSLADNINSEQSVLNLFKSEDQEEEKDQGKQANEQQVLAEYMNILNRNYAKYYNSLSPEEQLKRSKDLIRSEVLQKDWDTFSKVNKDYQDYSLFDKNLLAIKYSHQDFDPNDEKYKSEENFFGDLDKNVKERMQRENVHSYIYQNPANNEGIVDYRLQNNFKRKPYTANDQLDVEENERKQAPENWMVKEDSFNQPRRQPASKLSFKAKFELFNLFNEGWSVRDLSLRYGIMPYRVKAIVYQKRYFFDEVFPHLPFAYVRDLIAIEHFFEQHYGAVDYGVDLEEMREIESGYLQTNFVTADRNVDIAKLSEKEQERLRKFFEKKKSKKQDIVIEKFQGQGNKGYYMTLCRYYLKSWILHKTRSRHGVTRMFERIIKDSDKPYKLPVTVQTRLKHGPRIAGMKFGHK